jgi:hypothetical protein
MLELDTTKLDSLVNNNEVKKETFSFDDVVEGYRLFDDLMKIITVITDHEKLGIKNISDVMSFLSDDMDEDEYENLTELILNMLRYLKVSESSINDLLDDDEDISSEELESLVELLIERIGDNDIYEFVAYAIHNPDLVTDTTKDDVTIDWAFFENKEDCNTEKPNGTECFGGTHFANGKAMKGFWRYNKYFENEKTKGVSANNYIKKSGKTIKKSKGKWSSAVKSKWLHSMQKKRGEGFGKKSVEQKSSEQM